MTVTSVTPRNELGSATVQVWARRKVAREVARRAHRAALDAETEALLRDLGALPREPWWWQKYLKYFPPRTK